jgi:hypothetical protein
MTGLATRGGSEWESIKILSQENLAHVQIVTPRVTHEQAEAHTNLSRDLRNNVWKARKQSGSKHERARAIKRKVETYRVNQPQISGSPWGIQSCTGSPSHRCTDHLGEPKKLPANSPQTFDQWTSQTTWSLETKFWGDDEHPKRRICLKNFGL